MKRFNVKFFIKYQVEAVTETDARVKAEHYFYNDFGKEAMNPMIMNEIEAVK